ncbi:MAG: nucleotidyl transferase AbiEii/AbiGii toxin family protein [Myxococcales bacterium]|nr:nucleotidyl transferase AbiEii/AbiGii toxin family protein [Myxococcales bacterium]
MDAWLRRLARSPLRERWILRGGLVTCHHCPSRPAPEDIDLVGLGRFDEAEARREMRALALAPASSDESVSFHSPVSEIIWGDTPFPGLRTTVETKVEARPGPRIQIDLGFGDPLEPGPEPLVVGGASLLAVRAETMVAWKLHGLVEHGRGRWRAKDLADALLLFREASLDAGALDGALDRAPRPCLREPEHAAQRDKGVSGGADLWPEPRKPPPLGNLSQATAVPFGWRRNGREGRTAAARRALIERVSALGLAGSRERDGTHGEQGPAAKPA